MTPYISSAQLKAASTLREGDTAQLRRSLEELQGLTSDEAPTDGLSYTQLLELHERLSVQLQESMSEAHPLPRF